MEPSTARSALREAGYDDAVAIRAAQSEPMAFGAIYTHYLEPVYRYLYARTRASDDAEDLVQRVFLQAFKALPSYRQEGVPFPAWLFRIARNLLIDHERQRRATVSWTQLPDALAPIGDSEIDASLLRQEALCKVAEMVADLPPEGRELLALRFAAHLTASEIANVVGKSEKAVQKQIERTIHA